jgi:hypothetical protein
MTDTEKKLLLCVASYLVGQSDARMLAGEAQSEPLLIEQIRVLISQVQRDK